MIKEKCSCHDVVFCVHVAPEKMQRQIIFIECAVLIIPKSILSVFDHTTPSVSLNMSCQLRHITFSILRSLFKDEPP